MTRKALSYLEATKILRNLQTKQKPNQITFLASGSYTEFEIYIKAEAALRGIHLHVKTIPFGLLRQHVLGGMPSSESEVFLLLPWDFAGALDWRTGVADQRGDQQSNKTEIADFAEQIRLRKSDAIFYLPAPVVPTGQSVNWLTRRKLEIEGVARDLGAEIISKEAFSLDSYLASGCPISGQHLGEIAAKVARKLFDPVPEPKKIIVTDLDQTLWRGIIGEDGLNGITAAPEGGGYIHFIYQSMLKSAKRLGALIAVVSKNDDDLVAAALSSDKFILKREDFVSVSASYQPKSLQIRELAKSLNIGLEHFIFIDDNSLEIQEVGQALPVVTCIQFPTDGSGLVVFIETLHGLFPAHNVTDEDGSRTELYRKMAQSAVTISGEGHNIAAFLSSLSMKLTIQDRGIGDRTRAVQLINKTNQFNINGVRLEDDEVAKLLKQGCKLYTGSLSDVNGSHGEVLAVLIDPQGFILSYVMSCRIFQRRAEFVFLGILSTLGFSKMLINYKKTERNEPVRMFLSELCHGAKNTDYWLEAEMLAGLLARERVYFEIVVEVKI